MFVKLCHVIRAQKDQCSRYTHLYFFWRNPFGYKKISCCFFVLFFLGGGGGVGLLLLKSLRKWLWPLILSMSPTICTSHTQVILIGQLYEARTCKYLHISPFFHPNLRLRLGFFLRVQACDFGNSVLYSCVGAHNFDIFWFYSYCSRWFWFAVRHYVHPNFKTLVFCNLHCSNSFNSFTLIDMSQQAPSGFKTSVSFTLV